VSCAAGATQARPEIERKFLLDGLPELPAGHEVLLIEQGYLEGGGRLRRIVGPGGERHVIGEKRGEGLVRSEREQEIAGRRFRALWPGTAGRRVRKRRYRVPGATHVWEVDEFLDRTLVLAEVELRRADEEAPLPPWLAPHVVREVTLEPDYRNWALAR
jgi:adenylate cyclase